ncbi:MAG TPA: glycosyltransferase [Clostridiales bacterium]|nr:glycosyltransferase [Clostridiales bacterium]
MLITILAPAYNEEEVLGLFYTKVCEVTDQIDEDFELLFINDGSTDNTLKILRDLAASDDRVSYVDLSRNYGKEIAMAAGFDHVKGDAVIIMDADLQDPPELIKEMVREWKNGYDDVYAKRRSRKGESAFKRLTSKWYWSLLAKMSYIPVLKDTGDFRLLSRKALEALKQCRESERYTKGMYSVIGFKKKEILFDREERAAGKTKYNLKAMLLHAFHGITSMSVLPLKLAGFFGLILLAIAFITFLVLIIQAILPSMTTEPWGWLLFLILFIGGLQMIFLGIMGEYIGRIFKETKGRPLYFINDYHNGKKFDKRQEQKE